MAGPEGWQHANRELGDAVGDNDRQSRELHFAAARHNETLHLYQAIGRLEPSLTLARAQLDLALARDRRARSAHDHSREVAHRKGVSPDEIAPYAPDSSLVAAQAEFARAQAERERLAREISEIERALRARFGLQPE